MAEKNPGPGSEKQARPVQHNECGEMQEIIRNHKERLQGKMKSNVQGEGKMPEEVKS